MKRTLFTIVLALGFASIALAAPNEESTTTTTKTETTTKKKTHGVKTAKVPTDTNADNTEKNKRDRKDAEPTADQASNSKSDLDVTAEIRKSIMADKSLSTYAHNVKIIAQDGVVTLKGPVHSAAEKTAVEDKAMAAVGKAKVKSEIEVKP